MDWTRGWRERVVERRRSKSASVFLHASVRRGHAAGGLQFQPGREPHKWTVPCRARTHSRPVRTGRLGAARRASRSFLCLSSARAGAAFLHNGGPLPRPEDRMVFSSTLRVWRAMKPLKPARTRGSFSRARAHCSSERRRSVSLSLSRALIKTHRRVHLQGRHRRARPGLNVEGDGGHGCGVLFVRRPNGTVWKRPKRFSLSRSPHSLFPSSPSTACKPAPAPLLAP